MSTLHDGAYSEHNKSGTLGQTGNIFQGIVTNSDAGTYVVQVAPLGQRHKTIYQGIPLMPHGAHALGFKHACLPPVGSRVVCYVSGANQVIILGIVPQPDALGEQGTVPNRAVIGSGDYRNDDSNLQGYGAESSKLYTLNGQRPSDVTDTDHVIGNEFGVLLGLFQKFAVLKGSELAQVQCHVLDDLVRIVSHNFQHYTCLGEHKIYHDGKGLHLEVGLTDSPKESFGIPEPIAPNPISTINQTGKSSSDDSDDNYNLVNERIQAIERLKIFVGKLGDFVNVLLVRPPSETTGRALDGKPTDSFDKGLFQFQLHKDGGAFLRTTQSFTVEKSNWIRVPHRIATPEDPTGDDGASIEYPEKDNFKFDDAFHYQGQPFLYFLQLRDYLAYMQEEYGYKNFKAHQKDFQVNDEFNDEEDLTEITKVDPLSNTAYLKKTSYFSLMPNGGVSMKDAWGSGIHMDGGNIYLQAAKDIVMQPMRNLVAKVGRNVSIASREDIDLSSTNGGFRLKTDKSQYFYSDNSGIVLHSNTDTTVDFFPEEADDADAISLISGIVLKAPDASITQYGKFRLDRTTDSYVHHGGRMFMESDEGFSLISKKAMDINAKEALTMMAQGGLTAFSETTAFLTGVVQTVVGMEDQTFAVAKFGLLGKLPVQGFVRPDNLTSFRTYADTVQGYDIQTFVPNFQDDDSLDNLNFRFLKGDHYGIDVTQDAIPQTIVQMEELAFGIHDLENWEEVAVNDSYPYPGAGNEAFLIGGQLNNILQEEDDELHNKGTGNIGNQTLTEPINIFTSYAVRS